MTIILMSSPTNPYFLYYLSPLFMYPLFYVSPYLFITRPHECISLKVNGGNSSFEVCNQANF